MKQRFFKTTRGLYVPESQILMAAVRHHGKYILTKSNQWLKLADPCKFDFVKHGQGGEA